MARHSLLALFAALLLAGCSTPAPLPPDPHAPPPGWVEPEYHDDIDY